MPKWYFPGGPVVKTVLPMQGHRFDPGQGTKNSHASWCNQRKKKKRLKKLLSETQDKQNC